MSAAKGDLTILVHGGERGVAFGPASVPVPPVRWKTRVLAPAALIVVFAVLLLYTARGALTPPTPVEVVPVVVREGDGTGPETAVVQAPGWVEPDPFPFAVSALADGVVREVLVLEGEPVAVDQVVARLVDDEARLAAAQARALVAARRADIAAVEAALRAAQREWDHPVELTRRLRTSEAMLAERRAELERWPAELAAAEALAVELEAEAQRLTRLHETNQASQIEFIRARQQHARQQALVAATAASRPVLEAQIAQLEAEVTAATENLRLRIPETRALELARSGVAQAEAALAQAEAALEEAALRLSRMEVRSPASGVVMTRVVSPGSKVMLATDNPSSAHVLRLYDPARLQVRVDVPLRDAARVGVGQRCEIVVDVLPERVFRGRVTRIVHEADVQKNTVQVKVAIEDPAPELIPEMLARARFLARADGPRTSSRMRVFAPEALVRRGPEGTASVWLVTAGSTVERREVALGAARSGDWIEVERGLQAGDRLVANAPALRNGQRVRILGEAREVRNGAD